MPESPVLQTEYTQVNQGLNDLPKANAKTALQASPPVAVHHAFQRTPQATGNLTRMAAVKMAGGGNSPGSLQSQQVCFYLIFMVHGGIFVKKDCPIPP